MHRSTHKLAQKLGHILQQRKLRCVVAESCTGGGLAAAITEIPGSSAWFDRGFVTYSNAAKMENLAVPAHIISSEGAVSEATVRAMAQGAIANSDAEVGIAISGIAGPGGGSDDKPVGTVWIAWAGDAQPTQAQCYLFQGDRAAIRQQAVQVALEVMIHRCESHKTLVGTPRYYFALWPDNKTAEALYQRAQHLNEPGQCKPVNVENLHMTLAYLGAVTAEAVDIAKQIAGQLHMEAFKLQITNVNYWQHIHLRWLGLQKTPEALTRLVTQLNHDLMAIGFKSDKLPFTPHITIARKCTSNPYTSLPIEPLTWPVQEFCLVQSTGASGLSKYKIIQRWSTP